MVQEGGEVMASFENLLLTSVGGEKRGIVMAEETNFYDEARRLGIDTQSIPNEYWTPETVRGFMVGDSGPYVDALDYLWLLDRSKQ
jgi:acyl-CoA synthetase (AMP-forming)/AMP-acid ligase II